MSDLHGYDAWDDAAVDPDAAPLPQPSRSRPDESQPDGSRPEGSRPDGSRPPGRGPRTAPLILVAAAVLLVVALMVAMSALRPSRPEEAATARPPSTAPTLTATTTDGGTEPAPSPAPTAPPATTRVAPPATATPSSTATATATVTTGGTATGTATSGGTVAATVTASNAATDSAGAGDAAVQALNEIATREQGRRPRAGQIVVHLQNRSVGARDAYITPPSGGPTWTAADILAYHNEASARAGGATLLKDGDRWISATWNPAWRTREEAIQWCYVAYPEFGRNYEANNQLRSRCYVTTG